MNGLIQTYAANGEALLAFVTRKGDNEFYSFVKGELSPVPRVDKRTYEINFCNEIDLDWSVLSFTIAR